MLRNRIYREAKKKIEYVEKQNIKYVKEQNIKRSIKVM